MRHFIGADADGDLISTHTHKAARSGLGGWPTDFDLDNLDTENAKVIAYKSRIKNKEIVQWKLYECPCPATKGTCSCAGQARTSKRLDENGDLVDKPSCGFLVDGAPYDGPVSRVPGSALEVKIAGAEVPDGTKVRFIQGTQVQMMASTDPEIELTFTDGETEAVTLYAPAQGFTGQVGAYGRYTCYMQMKVRGWQTS